MRTPVLETVLPDTRYGRKTMKKTILAVSFAMLMSTSAMAAKVGFAMSEFNDNWLTVLRNATVKYAKENGIDLIVEDGKSDAARQLDQVNNFIASHVDAIMIVPHDASGSQAITDAAKAANIPLVYVNRYPANMDTLPANEAVVASDETESGTLEAFAVCQLMRAQGKEGRYYVLEGELQHPGAIHRTKDIADINGIDMCSFMKKIDLQVGNFQRDQAQNLMTNWLSSGEKFDAVIANNDEMAIGAIQAMKAAGISMDNVIVGGIDASQDALVAMKAGDLDVTVFQDAAGQGIGGLKAAIALTKGEKVPRLTKIPFQLVTPANIDQFTKKN